MTQAKTRHCLSDTEPLIMSAASINGAAHPTTTENTKATASSSNRMSNRIRQAFNANGSAGATNNQFAALGDFSIFTVTTSSIQAV